MLKTTFVAIVVLGLAAGAHAGFFEDFEEPIWSNADPVQGTNGWTDIGGGAGSVSTLIGYLGSQGATGPRETNGFQAAKSLGEGTVSTGVYTMSALVNARSPKGFAGFSLMEALAPPDASNALVGIGVVGGISHAGKNARIDLVSRDDDGTFHEVNLGLDVTGAGWFEYEISMNLDANIALARYRPAEGVWSDLGAIPGALDFSITTGRIWGSYGGGSFVGVLDNVSTTGSGPPPPPAQDFTWDSSGSGDWNVGNWTSDQPFSNPRTPGTSGSFANHSATFGSAISGDQTVFSNMDVSVRAITFDSSNSYAVAGQGQVSLVMGTQTTPVDLTGNSSIVVVQGNHQFQLPLDLQNETDVDIALNSSLTFNNTLNLGGNILNKTGDGNLAIRNHLVTGGGTVNLAAGLVSGNGTVGGDVINNGGTISPGDSLGLVSSSALDASQGQVPEPTSLIQVLCGILIWMLRRRDRHGT